MRNKTPDREKPDLELFRLLDDAGIAMHGPFATPAAQNEEVLKAWWRQHVDSVAVTRAKTPAELGEARARYKESSAAFEQQGVTGGAAASAGAAAGSSAPPLPAHVPAAPPAGAPPVAAPAAATAPVRATAVTVADAAPAADPPRCAGRRGQGWVEAKVGWWSHQQGSPSAAWLQQWSRDATSGGGAQVAANTDDAPGARLAVPSAEARLGWLGVFQLRRELRSAQRSRAQRPRAAGRNYRGTGELSMQWQREPEQGGASSI